jgi:NAD(P)-dependent dehydrogenase (short-subunit alcohol dehydrogenase family)
VSTEIWNNTLAVIMTGAFNTARAFCPAMVEKGEGSVVYFSSTTARYSFPWLAHYQAAKAGLVGLTRGLAFDLGPSGVRVNCVAPCLVATPDFGKREEFFRREAQHNVLKRLAKPNDLAALVAFLLSDEANFITGQEIECDGGYSLFAQDFSTWLQERGAGTRPGEDARSNIVPS